MRPVREKGAGIYAASSNWRSRNGLSRPGSGLGVCGPDVIAGEADVLPSQRGNMAHQVGRDRGASVGKCVEGGLQVSCVP